LVTAEVIAVAKPAVSSAQYEELRFLFTQRLIVGQAHGFARLRLRSTRHPRRSQHLGWIRCGGGLELLDSLQRLLNIVI